jgi:hypothetical protein
MPELARFANRRSDEGPTGPLLSAVVSKAPASLTAPLKVTVPGFDRHRETEIRRWMPRGETFPAAGDEALIAIADDQEPWMVAWWPAA